MAVRGRAAVVAAVAMAAVDRRLPNLDDFAGQSWSAWVERVGPPTTETVSDLEENSRNGRKKIDAMTLIKEDMSIFGHCPAHDEFYLVVCNHCGQVVKPQAFQKHCERRHGPLSKLCGRVQPSSNLQKCHAVNGRPIVGGNHGSTKSWREKSQSFFNQTQHVPEKTDKMPKDNLCLFVPVVNLEKISSFPKSDGDGIKAPTLLSDTAIPKQTSGNSKEVLGKPSLLASTKELASAKAGSTSVITVDTLNRKLENASSLSEKESGVVKSLKKISRKECDLNRQCGVVNPETKKVCTRLLTCKIHSVHQRREVQGRTKDFDVLVAELKASTKKGECPKDKSPVRKDIATERLLQDFSSMSQTSLVLTNVSTSSCHTKQPYSHCALSRSGVSSESDPDDVPVSSSEIDNRLYRFPASKSTGRVTSEESEEEAADDSHKLDCRYATRRPHPQAFCTFGSRLMSPGCYVFSRRLDRFCSALSSMLERHLSSHMWKRIPPAADHPVSTSSPMLLGFSTSNTSPNYNSSLVCSLPHSTPSRTSVSWATSVTMASRDSRNHHSVNYAAGSPHAAAACSQSDCMGGSQSITSPLPANTPSPSFSKLPSNKASKSSKAKEMAGNVEPEALARKRKQSPSVSASPPYKQTCFLDLGKNKAIGCQVSHPSAKAKPSVVASSNLSLNGTVSSGARVKRVNHLDCRAPSHMPVKASSLENQSSTLNGPKTLLTNCISDEEAKRRKNSATYCRPVKTKHLSSSMPSCSSSDLGGSIRRKKPVVSFEEKQNTMKVSSCLGHCKCTAEFSSTLEELYWHSFAFIRFVCKVCILLYSG
ncbi:ataxin-7-like protein 2 isoform X1 [Pseudonaja textilis]|uniref:ataxin-7-like protein 2 isoform X1 n=1 Tax=Pseudonaja textilis TaxID=8673 RepID=UPI000EA9346E|nr:ataxin-7-like protein 2 isoform X1 [Pseudonaja textilis]